MYVYTFIYVYNTLIHSQYIYIYYVCVSVQTVFFKTIKPTLQLHNALYNTAQNILHLHTFFKKK
jgi:hypothetical protein